MTLDVQAGGVLGRRPSFRGNTYTRVHRGQEVQSAWPKKRGNRLHPKTREQMEWFRQVQWAFKYQYPELQKTFAEAVKGTPLMPRDIYAMVQAGRFCSIIRTDGKVIYPMSGIRDVSASLDFLSQLPGSLLARGSDLWEAIEAPAEAGWTLTSTGPDTPPIWLPPSTATVPGQFSSNLSTGANSGNSACKGALVVPYIDMAIHQLAFGAAEVSGGEYQASIYELASFTIQSVVGHSASVIAPATATVTRMFDFATPLVLTAGTRYAFCHRRINATGTSTDGGRNGNADPAGFPIQQLNTILALAQAEPTPGQVFASGTPPLQYGATWQSAA